MIIKKSEKLGKNNTITVGISKFAKDEFLRRVI